ncbi:LysR family transcriptional regulator [Dickeya chrysanthemi]|uniref:LysR family transcriptional regulator n=1 Tax=Dickeya chrysanthemi TaxID=556 RepID=UPI0004830D72|nr:LysR family transcriptional regulator [Dickeya chrysanthemi]
MLRYNLNDLHAFVTVAREKSFTRAASLLGVSQSALSQSISNLEARLKIRLFSRTTRSVSTTVAGERLATAIGNRFDEIEMEVDMITSQADKPAGVVRITCTDDILKSTLLPKLAPLLREFPDIKIEFDINYGFTDIVADRFDAGVRFGETIDKNMVAIPISHKIRMAAVASPHYLSNASTPLIPKDLKNHRCINIRFPTSGGLEIWEFERLGEKQKIRVDGPLVFNTPTHVVSAAIEGVGIAYLPEDMCASYIEDGRLVRILEDWSPYFAGFYLYYPSRRLPSPALTLVINALRM